MKAPTDPGASDVASAPASREHGRVDLSDWIARGGAIEAGDLPPRQRPAYQLGGRRAHRRRGRPGACCTPPPTASTRRSSTARGSATSSSPPGSPRTASGSRSRPTTSPTSSSTAENVVGALLSDGWWRGQHGIVRRGRRLRPHHRAASPSCTSPRDRRGDRRRHRRHVAVDAEPHPRGRPRSPVRCTTSAPRPAGPSPGPTAPWDPCGRGPRLRRALPVAGAAGPPDRGAAAGVGPRARAERHIVDFGQNSNGWVRLRDLGPSGHRRSRSPTASGSTPTATSPRTTSPTPLDRGRAVADVPGRPRHLRRRRRGVRAPPQHQGFQYVRIDGHPAPRPATTSPASSCTPTSPPRRVRLLRRADQPPPPIADWSFRGNACEIPTDCPTRERAGWTGDWQIFVETAAYLYDVGDFSAKWLRDLAAEQRPDGAVTNIVPDPRPRRPRPATGR